jgi:hypothetical protein
VSEAWSTDPQLQSTRGRDEHAHPMAGVKACVDCREDLVELRPQTS